MVIPDKVLLIDLFENYRRRIELFAKTDIDI